MGGQADIAFTRFGDESGLATLVEDGDILCRWLGFADMVEHIEEETVFLTIDLFQLDGHIFYLLEGLRTKEIGGVVIGFQQRLVLRCHHRSQLLQVADHQQLHTSEGLVSVAEPPKHGVDGIEQVAAHHRDFIDDQQVERGDDATLLLAEVELALDMGIRHVGCEGQLEEGVYRHTTRIDGRHTCWRYDDRTFLALFYDSLQERRLTCAGFTRQEDAPSCVFNKIPRSAQVFIFLRCLIIFHSS